MPLLVAAACGVCLDAPCFGQMPPIDSASYAAKVIGMSGQVSVLKDTEPWALQIGDTVQVKQLILTGPDGQARFQVSDGSTFDVYPNSRVIFRKDAPNWKDLLDVLVGRVRVQIEHLYGPNPNRVLTPTAVISVRGTVFDITVDGEDETTDVEVEEGTVEV
ncbi:MAG: FecR family protein, partial [Bryobacteraceae bacterium]